jgi:hypothetical protein
MCATTEAQAQLKQLEAEFRSIQKRLNIPFYLADKEGLVRQFEAVSTDARILCGVFNIATPDCMLGARRTVRKQRVLWRTEAIRSPMVLSDLESTSLYEKEKP